MPIDSRRLKKNEKELHSKISLGLCRESPDGNTQHSTPSCVPEDVRLLIICLKKLVNFGVGGQSGRDSVAGE